MRFRIDWASFIVGSKFTVFASFYFVFEGNFPSTSSPGIIFGGAILMEGFLHYRFGGLIFGGAYFRNFTVYQLINASCFLVLHVFLACTCSAENPGNPGAMEE